MKNNKIIYLVIVAALVVATGCSQGDSNSAPSTSQAVPAAGQTDIQETIVEDDPGTSGGELVEFEMTARQWEFVPDRIEVNQGDHVDLHITSIDVTHGIIIPDFDINERLNPGDEVHIEFTADKVGTFDFVCSVPCGRGHGGMRGQLIVN